MYVVMRPEKSKQQKYLSLWVDEELAQRVAIAAAAEERSVASFIRFALVERLAQERQGD